MFRDRVEGGQRLAAVVRDRIDQGALVLGLPRGGVPVAREVALAIGGELDVLVVRKIGAPENPEYALGAIAAGVEAIDWGAVRASGYSEADVRGIVQRERAELERREARFRGRRPFPKIAGRDVIIVDDGIATGSTAKAAARAVRTLGPRRLIFASPISTAGGHAAVAQEVDEMIVLETPPGLFAISQGYGKFPQTTDEEVQAILDEARAPLASAEEISIPLADATLDAVLVTPPKAQGIVVFAHGSGSGRRSPRNRYVADRFHEGGFATLLVDLLSRDEAQRDEIDASLRFDIDLLSRRMEGVVDWLAAEPRARGMPIAIYGSSTGASAAIRVAARQPVAVRAVVSRGGRVDLAAEHLAHVRAPTLLIVGSRDHTVLALNETALEQLRCPKRLALVEGAGHLFEEPGSLDEVARLAVEWLRQHLAPPVETARRQKGG